MQNSSILCPKIVNLRNLRQQFSRTWSQGCDSEPELESGSIDCKSEPVKYMNWDLTGWKIKPREPIFRGQKMRGLESGLTWIGYKTLTFSQTLLWKDVRFL